MDNDLVKSNTVHFSYAGISLASVSPSRAFPDGGGTVTLKGGQAAGPR